jgi:protein-S-isoprenylcysteine O-methyltransferase Ste14
LLQPDDRAECHQRWGADHDFELQVIASMKLAIRTIMTAVIGVLVLGAIIFGSAGTLSYWQGWAFIIVFTISTNIIGIYLAIKDPALLKRRVKVGPGAETRPAQKALISLAMIGCVGLLVVSVLDHRFGWSDVSGWLSVLGNLLVALGLMIDLVVFRENTYGASTIRKMEGQTVISTGPYAVVRHPMYVGVLIMTIGAPLALGSWWGLAFLLLNAPILVMRILDEEAMLREELAGYADYANKVPHRLVPGLW